MPFELVKSETVLKGRAFEIRRDHVKTPDGRATQFDIVVHGGSVVIIPVDADGNLLFVRQYRHAAGRDLLELPAGTLDRGEEPAACAARERPVSPPGNSNGSGSSISPRGIPPN
jgi:ADP-ribose pyrophosphatase